MKKGFTLVELAIVLVIIGLLVGGVLAGQELIGQAKVRKNIAEFQNFQRGWSTFYLKYNTVPGDIKNPERFFPVCDGTKEGATINPSNGNGIIDNDEQHCILPQLAASGVYMPIGPKKDAFGPGSPSDDIDFAAGDAYNGMVWGPDKNGVAGFLNASMGSMQGYYMVIAAIGGKSIFTPADTMTIDEKLDDGKPGNGNIRASSFVAVDSHCGINEGGGSGSWLPAAAMEYDPSYKEKSCTIFYKLRQ